VSDFDSLTGDGAERQRHSQKGNLLLNSSAYYIISISTFESIYVSISILTFERF